MRILIAHYYYQQRGGEDVVVENETASLRKCGHEVETFMKRPDWSPLQRIHQACVLAGRKASNQAVLTNQITGSTDCTNHPGPRGFSR